MKIINLDIYTGTSLLSPEPPEELLAPLLAYRWRRSEAGEGGRIRVITEHENFGELDVQGRLAIPTGMILRVTATLKKSGYKIKKCDHRKTNERLKIAGEVLDGAIGPEAELCKAVQVHAQGVVQVTCFAQAIEYMAELIRLHPKARVFIPASSQKQARNICYVLQRDLGRKIAVWKNGLKDAPKGKIVVASYRPMHTTDCRQWDMVLVPEPISAMQDRGLPMMVGLSREADRLYAFLPTDAQLTERTTKRLEAICGPSILIRLPERVGVDLLRITTPSCRTVRTDSALEFKQAMYWQNDRRNDFVAAVARSLATGDLAKLDKYGIPIEEGEPMIRGGAAPRVTVLVESRQHADEMATRLLGWSEKLGEVKNTQTKSGHQIATATEVARDGLESDVIVVASGELSRLNSSSYLPRRQHADDPNILVVDFRDVYDEKMLEKSEQRTAHAVHRGWDVLIHGTEL